MRSLSLLDLEGLILNGFVSYLEIIDCTASGGTRLSKFVGELRDGTKFTTECYSYSRLSRIYLLYTHYKNKKWVRELSSGTVMSGITYDLG
ncbi:MAG: hypothetical protein QXD94_00685 [Sulfolobales archaeon]